MIVLEVILAGLALAAVIFALIRWRDDDEPAQLESMRYRRRDRR